MSLLRFRSCASHSSDQPGSTCNARGQRIGPWTVRATLLLQEVRKRQRRPANRSMDVRVNGETTRSHPRTIPSPFHPIPSHSHIPIPILVPFSFSSPLPSLFHPHSYSHSYSHSHSHSPSHRTAVRRIAAKRHVTSLVRGTYAPPLAISRGRWALASLPLCRPICGMEPHSASTRLS